MANDNNFFHRLGSFFGFGTSITPPVNQRQRFRGGNRLKPEESQQSFSLEYAQNTSHALHLNSAVARATTRAIRLGVLGSGIKLRSELKNRTKDRATKAYKMNEKANDLVAKEWEKWGRVVTIDGTLGWHDACGQVLSTIIESGEAFVRIYSIPPENRTKGVKSNIPLSIQIIEADALDSHHSGEALNDDYWLDGIKYDKFHRPLAYALKVCIRGTYETREYDARDILHLFIRSEQRPNSRRGWPWLVPVQGTIDRLDSFLAARLLHAEQSSAVTDYIIQDANLGNPIAPEEDLASYDDVVDQGNKGGGVRLLPPGSQVVTRAQIQTTAVDPYVETCQQQIAMAAGITYESLTLDHSRSNFSSARMGTLVNNERFDEIRKYLMTEFFDIIYRKWVSAWLLTSPKEPTLSENPDEYYHSWQHKQRPYVEPYKQLAAAKTAHELGVVSKTSIANDLGYDLDSEIKQMAKDQKAAKEAGITPKEEPQSQGPKPPSLESPQKPSDGV